jgi:spore germination protein GerM
VKRRMWSPGARAVAVLVMALGFAAAACGVPTDSSFKAVDSGDLPPYLQEATSTTAAPTTTAPPPSTAVPAPTTTSLPNEVVTVYFVLGRRLRPVERTLARPAATVPVNPKQVLEQLQSGPVEEDRPVGLRSALLSDVINEVKVAGGTATVDLKAAGIPPAPSEQVLAFGQIVATLTARPGIGRVAFTIDGRAVDVPVADGTLASDSISCDAYLTLLPPETAWCPAPPATTTAPTSTTAPPPTSAAPPPST